MEEEKQKKNKLSKKMKVILIVIVLIIFILLIISFFNGNIKITIGSNTEIITSDSYNGYYADVDGDGIVDGIIYADLVVESSGTWGDSWGIWEYTASNFEDFKQYYVSTETYTNEYFGERKIITAVSDSVGENRFYVMALEDTDESYHYWYYNAYENLDDIVGYTTNDFGEGITNTTSMLEAYINETYGTRYESADYTELWEMAEVGSYVNSSESSIWFVPSKSEWSAFGNTFEITSSNYTEYGLKDSYWSSSQCCKKRAYYAYFGDGRISSEYVQDSFYVRLSTIF